MTVAELITELQKLNPDTKVTTYEMEGDCFDNIAKVEDLGSEVRLHTQYAVDAELC